MEKETPKLQIIVIGASEDQEMVPSGRAGPVMTYLPGSITREVTLRAVIRSKAEYERWRSYLGKTLQLSEET